MRPRIAIRYCTQCRWLLRAAWLAQELLSEFGTDLAKVALAPGTGGVFEIDYEGETIWDRKTDGGFLTPRRSNAGCATGSIRAATLATSTVTTWTRTGRDTLRGNDVTFWTGPVFRWAYTQFATERGAGALVALRADEQ
jgi:selT/selW/selH-like putative selenoprotein